MSRYWKPHGVDLEISLQRIAKSVKRNWRPCVAVFPAKRCVQAAEGALGSKDGCVRTSGSGAAITQWTPSVG
jgi:hypothetical protein